MDDEFRNRLTSFTTALDFANEAEHKAVWDNQIPKSFTAKMGEAATMVDGLEAWCQRQSRSIAGAAEDKKRERGELADAAFVQAQALVTYFLDQDDATAAEPFRRTQFWWESLNDQSLLLRSQDVVDAATVLTTGGNAAAIAENYGISAAAVAALVEERGDFVEFVNAPATARSGRKAYTAALREKFRPVTAKFRDLDRLVPQFFPRPNGEAFVGGWFAARQVIDTGHGAGTGGGGGDPEPTAPGVPTDLAQHDESGTTFVEATLPAGATGLKLYRGAAGPEQTLLGEFTTLPAQLSLGGGPIADLFATAFNAVGQSAQVAVPVPE